MVDLKKKKNRKEEQNLHSQLEILELLVQDRDSIITGGTYMPGIQNNSQASQTSVTLENLFFTWREARPRHCI